MISRDHLALDRTLLANERTLLAYLRTSLMLFATGITMVKLFASSNLFLYSGICLVPLSFFVAIWGFMRFFGARNRLHKIDDSKK